MYGMRFPTCTRKKQPNVGKYTIHGWYGNDSKCKASSMEKSSTFKNAKSETNKSACSVGHFFLISTLRGSILNSECWQETVMREVLGDESNDSFPLTIIWLDIFHPWSRLDIFVCQNIRLLWLMDKSMYHGMKTGQHHKSCNVPDVDVTMIG